LENALEHHVFGVIWPHLDATIVPETVWNAFHYHWTILVAVQESVIRTFESIVSAFERANVRVCALKGPALSARLYGNPVLRGSIDLDFLVAPQDLDRAVALMTGLGYTGKSDTTVAYLLRHGHHLDFTKPGATSIELHFVAYAGFGVTLPSSALMDRAIDYRFSDRATVLVPSTEDEFIYLAVHGAGHSFARLLWLYDLKALVQKNPQLDWDQVVMRSRNARVSTAVGYAVRQLVQWFHMPLERELKAFPRHSLRLGAAHAIFPLAAQGGQVSVFNNLKGLVFTAMLCDRPQATVWMLQHHILRSMRRRAQRAAPQVLPESWSG
jgi:hypothetical protein